MVLGPYIDPENILKHLVILYKGNINVISSFPQCKNDSTRFTTIPLIETFVCGKYCRFLGL